MQSAASDLALMAEAAREGGALARDLLARPLDIRFKGEAGPVTNVDLGLEALLGERLRMARPDYGWLSEESPDLPQNRIGRRRVFMLDPIDGTAAMIAKVPQWTISIGLVEDGRPRAGVVYNPLTDELFAAAIGEGATLNGRPVRATVRPSLEGARMIGHKNRFASHRWEMPWPKMTIIERQSIAYRMALLSAGQGDATVLFGFKNEWDIAAGAALVEAAGGRVTDLWGEPLVFNQPVPRAPGVAAAGEALHPLLIRRTREAPDPRKANKP